LVNWLSGFAPVEHSAPPRKDMMGMCGFRFVDVDAVLVEGVIKKYYRRRRAVKCTRK
jgi:hypothetical protein